MIEARNGYCFDDLITEQTVINLEEKNIKYATHGYLPDKENYQCNFIASGSGIENGFDLGSIQMVDIAPTIANILGVDLVNCDGRILDEMFQRI